MIKRLIAVFLLATACCHAASPELVTRAFEVVPVEERLREYTQKMSNAIGDTLRKLSEEKIKALDSALTKFPNQDHARKDREVVMPDTAEIERRARLEQEYRLRLIAERAEAGTAGKEFPLRVTKAFEERASTANLLERVRRHITSTWSDAQVEAFIDLYSKSATADEKRLLIKLLVDSCEINSWVFETWMEVCTEFHLASFSPSRRFTDD